MIWWISIINLGGEMLNKYIVEVFESEKNHAGPKAKSDIISFLKDDNYKRVMIDSEFTRCDKLFFYKNYLKRKVSGIMSTDLVVIQHPMNIGKKYEKKFIRELNEKNCKIIVLVHDLCSFRHENRMTWKEEISFLNLSNGIIAHNNSMKTFLENKGVSCDIVTLDIFDYKVKDVCQRNVLLSELQNINFAGNINKSQYIYKMIPSNKNKIYLFGICDNFKPLPERIVYEGSYSPEVIPNKLKNGLGLIWDGSAVETCQGIFGEYLKINNPHKASLYLAAGLPVVIWDKAALAPFIIKNKLGFTISSLKEINNLYDSISETSFKEMKYNISEFQKRITKGFYIKKALKHFEEE